MNGILEMFYIQLRKGTGILANMWQPMEYINNLKKFDFKFLKFVQSLLKKEPKEPFLRF